MKTILFSDKPKKGGNKQYHLFMHATDLSFSVTVYFRAF